ncbi:hypothetical protein H0H92_007910 [Tricholoma furcatifolium]|nr:hypothetical protein H0H92_007910 [Tricholoma furcatifolium]
MSSAPPKYSQVLIIGAGPAGSYAASALAREGLDVTVLEADKFPRYRIGESLIPSARQYFRFIGAESTLDNHGFVFKPGSTIKFNQFKREGYTDFMALGSENNAWNVIRSEFDQLLMDHARSSGASVHELVKVTDVSFSPADSSTPVSVTWSYTPPAPVPSKCSSFLALATSFLGMGLSHSTARTVSVTGTTTFDYLIDATGRAGLLSNKYLKNRHYNASLKNVAVWAYWRNTDLYGAGTLRQGSPWFEALADETGWAWHIPLHDGTVSVGVVIHQKCFNSKHTLPPSPFSHPSTSNPTNSTLVARYLSTLSLAPGIVKLISTKGVLNEGSVKRASDFSYSAASYAGTNFRIVGDAGASATICASVRGHCSEQEAAEWHTKRVSTSYTRFQVVVLSAYKQIRAQHMDILCDVDEDNYDRAFSLLRPVIQGASDMGKRLSETELQKTLDFCVNLFNPTSPEQHERLSRSFGRDSELLDISAPVIDPTVLENALRVDMGDSCPSVKNNRDLDDDQTSDSERTLETKMILEKINARRVVHSEFVGNIMEIEPFDGYVMRLERGLLGLTKVKSSSR